MPLTLSPIAVKNSGGTAVPMLAYTDGNNSAFAGVSLDATGAVFSPATAANQATTNAKLDALVANTAPGAVCLTLPLTVTVNGYTTGMCVGGKLTLPNTARVAGGSGVIQTVQVCKKTPLDSPFDVFLFHTFPAAAITDRVTLPDISGDFGKLIGIARCTDLIEAGAGRILQATGLGIPFDLPPGGTSLFAVAVLRGTESYATADALTLNLHAVLG